MPAALDVDWEAIKTLAIAIGLKPAAEKTGVPYDAIRQRSCREGWLESIPRNQPMPPTVSQPVTGVTLASDAMGRAMADLSGESRLSLAVTGHKLARHFESQDAAELAMQTAAIKDTVTINDKVHSWNSQGPAAVMNVAFLSSSE